MFTFLLRRTGAQGIMHRRPAALKIRRPVRPREGLSRPDLLNASLERRNRNGGSEYQSRRLKRPARDQRFVAIVTP
jgi:hypothetical protein